MRRERLNAAAGVIAATVAAALACGCQTEERVVRYRPMLSSVPGAQFGTQPTGARFRGQYVDPTSARDANGMLTSAEDQGGNGLVIEMPDGTKRLVSSTARHIMVHIINTIDANDKELFLDQVLSEVTKEEFVTRGLDPGLAFDELRKRRSDIKKLFDKMPMGEFSPGMYMRGVGNGVQRLRVHGAAATDLRWTFMDIRFEDGQWRLRWFGP